MGKVNIDYSALNRCIKDNQKPLAKRLIRSMVQYLNKEQSAYKTILTVDYEVCLHKYTYFDGNLGNKVVTFNPVQGRLKLNSHKLSILYSALNILEGKPTNHIPSDLGESINDVLPTLIQIFNGTEYLPQVKLIQKDKCEKYRKLNGINLNRGK